MSYKYTPGEDIAIDMVNRNRILHPGGERVFLVKERELRQLEESARRSERKVINANFETIQDEEYMAREANVQHVGGALLRAAPGIICLIGAGEGLMNLYFAGVVAVPFLVWAAAHWLNK